jgi:hypothetical protein
MRIEFDHPTITHLLGYLTEGKWADAIRNKSVNIDVAWELLRIQDKQYNGNMVECVKELVEMSKEDYIEYMKSKKLEG